MQPIKWSRVEGDLGQVRGSPLGPALRPPLGAKVARKYMVLRAGNGPEAHLPQAQARNCSLGEPSPDYNSQMPSVYSS